MRSVPSGAVLLSSWMKTKGYSLDLQRVYRNSNWLESIGNGAMIRKGDSVSYDGALFALQKQANLSIHIGGRSALNRLGKAHFLELSTKRIFLFGATNENLPVWFRHINLEKINLGSGKRSIIAGDAYNVKYQITVDKELGENNEPDL